MRYREPTYFNGKKRIKLIVLCVVCVIFLCFFVILQIFISIFSLRTKYLPTTSFFCVALDSIPDETEIKSYVSRGAGAVVYQSKLVLAAFSQEAQAKSVSESLTEQTCVIKITTPKVAIDHLTDEQITQAKLIYAQITDCIKSLCDQTIALDKKELSEQNFRIWLGEQALTLASLTTHSTPLHSFLLHTISSLHYLNSSTTYTDNLTPYISVVRSVTLNLLFSSNT